MESSAIKPQARVKTIEVAKNPAIIFPSIEHLKARVENAYGTVTDLVPGHGGKAWFVRHDGTETVGAYLATELEPL